MRGLSVDKISITNWLTVGKLAFCSPGHNQNWRYGDVIRKVNMAAKAGHTIFSHF